MFSVWVLIPIVALLVGAWQEWLKFKAGQAKIGTSTTEIENALEKMTEQNVNLTKRMQNLEAIVTSQDWDDHLTINASISAPKTPVIEIPEPEPVQPSDADQVANLAKKMRS